jgi:hypothetical protein
MSEDLNFRDTIKPKSDQLNADDLIAGPITVTITGVKRGNAEQPVECKLNNGYQPYKPCKSMRRVMVAAWGDDGRAWVGRSLTLYADPDVVFGGVKVGGIRISHMSHIKGTHTFMLTTTRSKRKEFTVRELADIPAEQQVQQYPDDRFATQLPVFREMIASGKATVDSIAASLEKKGARLTAVQRDKLAAPDAPAVDDEVF